MGLSCELAKPRFANAMPAQDLFEHYALNGASSEAATTATPSSSPRFGVGEWYGVAFMEMTPQERMDCADYRSDKSKRLAKTERERLIALRTKQADATSSLTVREQDRLNALESKIAQEVATNKVCPFKKSLELPLPCSKDGGVCSLLLFTKLANSNGAEPIDGERGAIRALCPNRFHEDEIAFKWASETLLKQPSPSLVGEVGFLESEESLDGDDGEDVGRIDMVLVDVSKPDDYPMPWAALEIQAVYFSGAEMSKLFRQIKEHLEQGGDGVVFPNEIRRPDYRSSGPKRLMPQLQIKVPTLRRWGKKMALVVDRPFFTSMGSMETVKDVSNADVIWFVVDFELDKPSRRYRLKRGSIHRMTLEESVKGLTGGGPITLDEFEESIRAKLKS
jgi:hypothetical protein